MAKKYIQQCLSGKNISAIAVGGGMLIFSSLLLFYLIPNYIAVPPILQNPMMSPRWLATILGWLILGMSVLLIMFGMSSSVEGDKEERPFACGSLPRLLLMIAALLVYVSLFEVLGSIVSGILATLLLFIAHPVRIWWVYSLAFIFPIAVSLLFTKVMNVPLPLLPF